MLGHTAVIGVVVTYLLGIFTTTCAETTNSPTFHYDLTDTARFARNCE